MPSRLFLDTARLGLASREVQRANRDFARLASEEGLTLYASRLLTHGFHACPQSFQRRYRGLHDWDGVPSLKSDLCELASLVPTTHVLLANRSAQLMKFAARLLFQHCRRVLTTDLAWPGYATILERERHQIGGETIRAPLRHSILWNGFRADDVADRVESYCRQYDCDGLFLIAISHDGIRLPVESICNHVRTQCGVRFIVVDGAQAFCHSPPTGDGSSVDIYLASAHKWLRAMHPLGVAFLSNPDSQRTIHELNRHQLAADELDDPLLSLTEHIENARLPSFTETVHTVPLFTTQAAATERLSSPLSSDQQFAAQLENAELIGDFSDESRWQMFCPADDLRSAIVLLRSQEIMNLSPDAIQQHFLKSAIGLSAYPNGWVRLALPPRPFTDHEVLRLRKALAEPLTDKRLPHALHQFWSRSAAATVAIPAVV